MTTGRRRRYRTVHRFCNLRSTTIVGLTRAVRVINEVILAVVVVRVLEALLQAIFLSVNLALPDVRLPIEIGPGIYIRSSIAVRPGRERRSQHLLHSLLLCQIGLIDALNLHVQTAQFVVDVRHVGVTAHRGLGSSLMQVALQVIYDIGP